MNTERKAIIFDNDGVLVDTEPLYFQATKEMCAKHGLDLSLELFIECHIKNSHGTRPVLGLPDEEYERWRQWRNSRYSELLAGADHTKAGVPEMVGQLAKHFRLCIVTSSKRSHFDIIHQRSSYLPHFEFIVSVDDVSESKPSPEPYLTALERLALEPAECIIIEDSSRGLQSARAAGIDCVILKTPLAEHQDLTAASHTVDSINALSEYLLP
jgi:HAD superfamily hydrolase (TIGR01509 family)